MTPQQQIAADRRREAAFNCATMRQEVFDSMVKEEAERAAKRIIRRMKSNECEFTQSHQDFSKRANWTDAQNLADTIADVLGDAFERPDPESEAERAYESNSWVRESRDD